MLGHFKKRDAKRPDIRGDGVGLARDAFGRHVIRGANECICIAFGAELAADAEVAESDLARAGKQNIGGLDICNRSADGRVFQQKSTHLCE